MFLSPVWSGELSRGRRRRRTAAAARHAAVLRRRPEKLRRHAGLLRRPDRHRTPLCAADPNRAELHTGGHRCPHRGGQSQSSALSGVFVHHFHGAATRAAVESTAFGIRAPHFVDRDHGGLEPRRRPGATLRMGRRGVHQSGSPRPARRLRQPVGPRATTTRSRTPTAPTPAGCSRRRTDTTPTTSSPPSHSHLLPARAADDRERKRKGGVQWLGVVGRPWPHDPRSMQDNAIRQTKSASPPVPQDSLAPCGKLDDERGPRSRADHRHRPAERIDAVPQAEKP